MKDFLRKTLGGMFLQTHVVNNGEPTTVLQEGVANKVAVGLGEDFSGHNPFIQKRSMAIRQDEMIGRSEGNDEKINNTAGLLNKNYMEILDISVDRSMSDIDFLKRIDELVDELIVSIKGPTDGEKGLLKSLGHFKQLRKMSIFIVFQNIESLGGFVVCRSRRLHSNW